MMYRVITTPNYIMYIGGYEDIGDIVEVCSNSIALAKELPQSCMKLSI